MRKIALLMSCLLGAACLTAAAQDLVPRPVSVEPREGVFMLPSMLIQIPVENAIKHGLRTKQGKRLLNVQIRCGGEAVEIIIRDNGGGYREKSLNRGTGTGMKVITRTIQLLNYYNRTPITMCIGNVPMDDGETGCEVRFVVPLDYSYQLNKR